MLLVRNKGGRIVEVSTESERQDLLMRGFTAVTDEEREQYIIDRQQRFREAAESVMDDDNVYNAKLDVFFQTAHKRGDGYGMSSYHIRRELRNFGVNLNFKYQGQKIGLLYHRPTGVTQMQNEIRVIYTMFESTKVPTPVTSEENPNPEPDWKQYCDFADKVLVPSHWCQKVFAESGIETDVLQLGYNDRQFTYIDRPIPVEENKDFVFLHYNAFNLRKGFTEVLKAWVKAFPPDKGEPVKLILKTTLEYPPIPLPKSEYPNIEIITGEVSEEELHNILARSNAFVFPSRGEGFGITPLEAMATGLPAIVPNAHGISEYFDPEYMYEVPVKEMTPAAYHSYKGMNTGEMVICDVNALAKQMRWLYTHQQEAKEKGRIAAEKVKEKWTYRHTAEKLAEVLFELDRQTISKKRDSNLLPTEPI